MSVLVSDSGKINTIKTEKVANLYEQDILMAQVEEAIQRGLNQMYDHDRKLSMTRSGVPFGYTGLSDGIKDWNNPE
jgi:hypothetical protein